MKSLVLTGSSVLAVACNAEPPPTGMNVDGLPTTATVTATGTRERIDVVIEPDGAVLAGENLGTLAFRIGLSAAVDCPGECLQTPVRVTLDGQDTTGSFDYGGSTYEIGPILDPVTQRYLFARAGDPLQVPRGKVAAAFDFHHLDRDSASFQLLMFPLFDVGFPAPGVPHVIGTGGIDVAF